MFDSVLDKGAGPRSAFGKGALFSILFHLGALACASWFTSRDKTQQRELTEVTFFAAPAAPLPSQKLGSEHPASNAEQKPVEKKKVQKKPDTFVQSKELPKDEPQPEAQPEVEQPVIEDPVSDEQGVPEGKATGELLGSPTGRDEGRLDGTEGGEGTAAGGEVPRYAEGMTRPRQLGGDPIRYPRQAREARIAGVALAECIITVEGTLERCRMIKSLPLMEDAILSALRTWRYTPVIYQGKPVSVRYVFTIRLQLE